MGRNLSAAVQACADRQDGLNFWQKGFLCTGCSYLEWNNYPLVFVEDRKEVVMEKFTKKIFHYELKLHLFIRIHITKLQLR